MMDKVILIISMILVFYISVNSIQNFKIKYETLDSIIKEFKTGYISDIKVMDNSCPPNYESLVRNFDWPGSYKGCGCLKDKTYEFYPFYCPQNCQEVEETNPKIFNKWRGKVICYRRDLILYENLPLISNKSYHENSECRNDTHKICGVIDGKENLLCVENNWECPLSNLKIVNESDNNYMFKFDINNRTLIADKNNSLNIIPILFRIDTTQPCLDPSLSPSSEYYFPLMKKRLDLVCDKYANDTEITDINYNSIDSYPLDEYFKDNNFYNDIHNLIDPFGIDISKEIIKIYSKNYPGWSLNCRQFDQLHSFLSIADVLNVLLISIILHAFISIISLLLIAIFACFVNNYFELLFKLVNVCFCVINLIFPIQVISNSNWIINIMSDENGAFCGDEVVNILLSEISSACLDLQYSYIIVIFLTIIYCVFLIYTIYKWIKPYNAQYQLQYSKIRELK